MLMGAVKDLRVAWLADIFDELSGVVTDTIELHSQAQKSKVPWHPVTCYPKELPPFKCFKHLFKVSAGRVYKGTHVYVPDFMEIVIYLRSKKINLIISNTPATIGLTAMAAARYLGIPWVDIYHTDVEYYLAILSKWYLRPLLRPAMWYVKQYHKRADLIFVRTQKYFDLMVQKGHPPNKIRFYRAGVNLEHFNPKFNRKDIWEKYSVDADKVVVLFVGRITKVKDISYLLDYFKEEEPKNAELVMIGHGPEMEEYLDTYGQIPNIHFLGTQIGRELQELFASADLYVLPSASETLGKTVLEAMSSGVPVLVSSQGGPKDYVTEGESGRVFEAGNYGAFKDAFKALVADKSQLAGMGEAARQAILPYTDDKLFKDFSRHIAELI